MKVTPSKNIWRWFCITIFLFGAVSFLHANANKSVVGFQSPGKPVDISDTEPALPYVAECVDSEVSSDGTITVTGSSTRYAKANGEWRLEIIRYRGLESMSARPRQPIVYSGGPEGVFQKQSDSGMRRHVSTSSDQSILQLYRSGNYLRAHPEFVRTDEVAGLKVYVFRTDRDPSSPLQWSETSYSPRTGLYSLRTVMHFRDGIEIRSEAVSVEFKEVPDDLNNDLKNLPIKQKQEDSLNKLQR